MSNVWFITGSQHLYGDDALIQVAEDSKIIAAYLNDKIGADVICTNVVTTSEEINIIKQLF